MRPAALVLQAGLQAAEPLPECARCARPTRRATHRANAGLCSSCSSTVLDAAARDLGTPRDAR